MASGNKRTRVRASNAVRNFKYVLGEKNRKFKVGDGRLAKKLKPGKELQMIAVVGRKSVSKHINDTDGNPMPTILLEDIKTPKGVRIAGHTWVIQDKVLGCLYNSLEAGTKIQFVGKLEVYESKTNQGWQKKGIESIRDIQIIKS